MISELGEKKSPQEQACLDANDQIVSSMDTIKEQFIASGNEVYELSDEEIQVFKDAVADVTREYAAQYGEEACAAFDIVVE